MNPVHDAVPWLIVLVVLAAAGCGKAASDGAQPAAGSSTLSLPVEEGTPGDATSPPAATPGTTGLFVIERSKNANVIHYDARLTPDGGLDPDEPVVAYWIMAAEDGHRENLTWLEKKKAYGFSVERNAASGGFRVALVAVPDRQVTVKMAGKTVRAEMTIDGRRAVIERIYINASDGFTGPKVHYYELFGKDPDTGEKRYEKIVPD